MRISTITFFFAFFLFTTSNAKDISNVQVISSNFDNPSNPWVLKNISLGQTIELKEVKFEMDESDLNENSKKSLRSLADFLILNKSIKIEIGGHTSSMPPHEYCDNLSNNRAQSVRQYLISIGISPKNIVATGYGKRKSKYSNLSSTGRKLNQRVEVTILSL